MVRAKGTTTDEVLTVNGVVLNTLAKNIESLTGRLRTPAKRTSNVVVPGRHGAKRTAAKKFDQNTIVLPMWVIGSNDDGTIPSETNSRELFFRNVDELTHLFQGRDEVLDIRHTLPDGSVRQCFGDVQDVIDFSTESADPLGRFSVSIVVPDAFWHDLDVSTETQPGSADTATFHTFRGATAPMEDLELTIQGPWNTPRLTFSDGSWVQYTANLVGTQGIVINAATWKLSGVEGHVPSLANLTYSGPSSHWFSLPPEKPSEASVIALSGTSRTALSSVTLSGRRKFLVG